MKYISIKKVDISSLELTSALSPDTGNCREIATVIISRYRRRLTSVFDDVNSTSRIFREETNGPRMFARPPPTSDTTSSLSLNPFGALFC